MLRIVESAIALNSLPRTGATGPAVSVVVGGAHRLDPRLSPPHRAAGLVSRPGPVRGLLEAGEVPLALLVAPAGYGNTTRSEWAERDPRPFAWVRLDAEDDHPARLIASIAAVLEASEPVGKGVFTALSSRRPEAARRAALPRLLRYLNYREQPVVLVLDDVHALRAPESFRVLQAIAEAMPSGSQLALASRREPGIAVGSLRAHRMVVELRAGDLAMRPSEATALLVAAGLRLGPDDVETLVRRTEGWAAGLYLAALSLRDQRDAGTAVSRFGGADRLVAEYLRDEFLAPLGAEGAAFLMRTSILDSLSGPLCDAVLESSGSGRMLADLARSNALLVSLDSEGESYRHHILLAEMLRAELRRLEPRRESTFTGLPALGTRPRERSTWRSVMRSRRATCGWRATACGPGPPGTSPTDATRRSRAGSASSRPSRLPAARRWPPWPPTAGLPPGRALTRSTGPRPRPAVPRSTRRLCAARCARPRSSRSRCPPGAGSPEWSEMPPVPASSSRTTERSSRRVTSSRESPAT